MLNLCRPPFERASDGMRRKGWGVQLNWKPGSDVLQRREVGHHSSSGVVCSNLWSRAAPFLSPAPSSAYFGGEIGLRHDPRGRLLEKKSEQINRRIRKVERASSLTTPRRAAWEHGDVTLGFSIEIQKLAHHGGIPKARESLLGQFCFPGRRNYDRAPRRLLRAPWLHD